MRSLVDAYNDFLLAREADGVSRATARWYGQMLAPLIITYDCALTAITVQMMRQYVVNLRSKTTRYERSKVRVTQPGGLSHESLRGHIRAAKNFFNWCWEEYQIAGANPMSRIKIPPPAKQPIRAISMADLKRLIAACDSSAFGKRDRAILYFLADTGCRAAGLLGLRRDALNMGAHRATITEKGNKTRVVPFTSVTARHLLMWLVVRPQITDFVFCSMRGRDLGQPLTHSGLLLLLRRLKQRAGVTGRVNPHSFRHAMASGYISRGGDLSVLKEVMGHEDMAMTARYARLADDEIVRLHELYSPVKLLEL